MYTDPSKKKIAGRLIFVFLFPIVSIILAYLILNVLYPPPPCSTSEKTLQQNSEQTEKQKNDLSKQDYKKEALSLIKETHNTFLNWSILIIGGSLGFILTGRSNKIQRINWALSLIPPAWIFLGLSLYYAVHIKARITHLLLTENFNPYLVNRELWLQLVFFWVSLAPLSIIVIVYFVYRFLSKE